MLDIAEWLDELRTLTQGADDNLLKQQLRLTVRDFARRSVTWRKEYADVNVRAGRSRYDFSRIQGGIAHIVHSVMLSGRPIPLYDNRPVTGATGRFAYVAAPGIIHLNPEPTEDITDGLSVVVSYIPTGDKVPDEFVNMWYDAIAAGAAARLRAIPDRPFTSYPLAQFDARRYRALVAEARIDANARFSKAETGWAFPRWA